ncbi:MAG: APC family permease [Clostridia bacterium]|nr:APC family permease [Clostridia bacterium]
MQSTDPILTKRLSPLNAWAFSFACAIGWGAFVMPATFFLPNGGITGSVWSFVIGGAVMCVIAMNYHYLGNQYPSHGGIYYLVKASLSQKQAFAASWAIGLAHLCCIPLNAKAMGMLLRTILEETLGVHFEVFFFQSDTLMVETVLVVVSLLLFGMLNVRGIKQTARIQTVGAIVLLGGIVIMLAAAIFTVRDPARCLTPAYYPGTVPNQAFMTIFIMTPWAFVGFDTLSKVSSEANFSMKKLGRIMVISVVCSAFAYLANIFIALLGMPEQYSSWPEYLDSLKGLSGIAGFPVALAAKSAMGTIGTVIFFAACISATLTGLVGFFASISRLIYQMGQDGVLMPSLGKIDPRRKTPVNAIRLVVIIALVLSLLRNAFDFIEELASVATAVGYGYCSMAALMNAIKQKKTFYIFTGATGMLVSFAWIFFQLVPVRKVSSAISETAMICVISWIFLGILIYVFCTRKNSASIMDNWNA